MDAEFVSFEEAMALHREQLELHGGQEGFVDEGAVRSALARPEFAAHYGTDADLADLAASYLYGLATTQGFSDGNKRTALVVAEHFLHKNGWRTRIGEPLMYVLVMAVVRGELGEAELAETLRERMEALPQSAG